MTKYDKWKSLQAMLYMGYDFNYTKIYMHGQVTEKKSILLLFPSIVVMSDTCFFFLLFS